MNPKQNLLQEWSPAPPDPVDLRRGVWSKIEKLAAPVSIWAGHPFRPALAGALAILAVVGAMHLGSRVSEASLTRAYLSSVNPYSHFQ